MQTALLVITIAVALLDWASRLWHHERLETYTKPITTVLVIGLALVSGAPAGHIAVAVVALVLCLGGDVALMPVVDKFVVGLASFLLGHLVFIGLFVQYGLHQPRLAGIAILLGAVLIMSVGNLIVRGAAANDPALKVPVTAYLFVITTMTAFGWATGMGWVIAGTTLFVISDSILGWRQFVRERAWMSVAVMVTYHGAIASLALSLW
ncbi:MAG: lysoplasmalogenase [Actinomycetota bacterium]|nr:lysoplasmalogenase [Actinomycetota bacterium]